MAWVWLLLGGLFEVGFTTCLRHVDGFRNLPWTLGFQASVAPSMSLLELASRQIPLGTAYAIWGGLGALGTLLCGIAFYQEPLGGARIAIVIGHTGCILGLRPSGRASCWASVCQHVWVSRAASGE